MAKDPISVPVSLPRMDTPVVDAKTGLVAEEWYRYFESLRERTGGDIDLVDANGVQVSQVEDKADATANEVAELKSNEIVAGRGLEGGGPISAGVQIDAKTDSGWIASTGTADKTTPFAVHTPIVGAVTYTPAQVTALSSAISDLGKRYRAMEAALLANEALTP